MCTELLDRKQAEHVLDSFFVIRKYEERDFGEYRTKRLILEAYTGWRPLQSGAVFAGSLRATYLRDADPDIPTTSHDGQVELKVVSYRDSLRLLLVFTAERTDVSPAQLQIENLDAPLVAAFLDHLEHERGNNARTLNTPLAAIDSLFRHAALQHPEHAATIARVLAIPPKRCDKAVVSFLADAEVDALLAAPDTGRWISVGATTHCCCLRCQPGCASQS